MEKMNCYQWQRKGEGTAPKRRRGLKEMEGRGKERHFEAVLRVSELAEGSDELLQQVATEMRLELQSPLNTYR